jgi:hypothetical protein
LIAGKTKHKFEVKAARTIAKPLTSPFYTPHTPKPISSYKIKTTTPKNPLFLFPALIFK